MIQTGWIVPASDEYPKAEKVVNSGYYSLGEAKRFARRASLDGTAIYVLLDGKAIEVYQSGELIEAR